MADKGKAQASKRGREKKDEDRDGKNARPRKASPAPACQCMERCRDFLKSLNLDDEYFNTEEDRCFCHTCAAHIPDVLEHDSEHGYPYEVPKGWSGFGLHVPKRGLASKMFNRWAVSFHGCPSTVLASILDEGQLMKPGDFLLDGTQLPNRLTGEGSEGEDRTGLYTSPSIKYSELDIYTNPVKYRGNMARVVLQCRQKMDISPPQLRIEGETIGWHDRFGEAAISKHVSNTAIERYTTVQNSIIPYRVLVSMNITTREHEETVKKILPRRVQAAALKAKEAKKACEAVAKRSKDAQAKLVTAQAALEHAHIVHRAAQFEAKAAEAQEGPAAAAEKAAQDGLVSGICAMVTDQDILSTLQPVIQGLVLHQLDELVWRGNETIDWEARAGLEGAAALAAAIASSSSLTAVYFDGEQTDRVTECTKVCTYVYTYKCIFVCVCMNTMCLQSCVYIYTYIYIYMYI